MVKLKSVEEVITVLGGFQSVADITGCKYGAVWQWQNTLNKFPANTYRLINEELERRGLGEASPALWGMKKRTA